MPNDDDFEREAHETAERVSRAWERRDADDAPLPGSAFEPTNVHKSFQNSPELGAKPLTESGAVPPAKRVSLADAAKRVRDNLWLGESHPDLIAARADYEAAKSRGDSLDDDGPAPTGRTRQDRTDEVPPGYTRATWAEQLASLERLQGRNHPSFPRGTR